VWIATVVLQRREVVWRQSGAPCSAKTPNATLGLAVDAGPQSRLPIGSQRRPIRLAQPACQAFSRGVPAR
jgi:hypothetical protein